MTKKEDDFFVALPIHLTGIWLLVALMVLIEACDPKAKVVESTGKPIPELVAIDSFMWKQPDSAFAVLRQFAASPQADSIDVFNGHCCQLLLSELLYKNFFDQSNRKVLLLAVDYFDSIVATSGTDRCKEDAHGMFIQEQNVFFDARAHYINGVGYYERGEIVNACEEYLKALQVMEEQFEEKTRTGKKAVFMFYIYNRLLELFSAQFMMDPAITCGENALAFCRKVPSLSKEIPNTFFHIGKQYDKKGEIDVAKSYYEKAIEEMPDTNSPIYRDAVCMKALCDYQLGLGLEQSLKTMKQCLASIKDEREKVARFLVIGSVYSEEGIYDSAIRYFEYVFKNTTDVTSKIRAAESIRVVYDSLGYREKSSEIMRYLTDHKESEGENKALVSKLEGMFKDYMYQKQEKEAEEVWEKSVRKSIEIIVPIAIMITLTLFIVVKLRSKTILKKQQEEVDRILEKKEQEHEKELRMCQAEADKTLEEVEKKHEKELETERLADQKKQEALQQNLLEKEAHVNVLENALNQLREEAQQRRMAFMKEPICEAIINKAKSKQITTRDVAHELGIALKDVDLERLGEAVAKHYDGFDYVLLSHCPNLKHGYLALCHLHLLGLSESEIAALKNVSYSAIRKQNERLREKFGVNENISAYVLRVAESVCGTSNVEQKKQLDMGLQRTTEEKSGQFIGMERDSSLKRPLNSSQKILELISASPSITISEIADRLGITKRGVDKNIKRLKEQEIIRRVGPDKGGHWEVIK